MIDKLFEYLTYPFVAYALIVGVLIALCASLLGVTLVLRRYSFIGDGLSHVAFGALVMAMLIGFIDNMIITLIITIIAAIFILRTGNNKKINGDAVIAMISVSFMAIGYLLMNIFPVSTNLAGDVCVTLFGSTSILTLSSIEVITCIILSIIVISLFIIFFNKIFATTFDEDFSKVIGTKTNNYNLLLAVMIAVIVVLAMNLVGTLLISALIIFPALSALSINKSYKGTVITSAVVGVLATLIGIITAILVGTPVGSTIVAINIIVFILFFILGFIKRR